MNGKRFDCLIAGEANVDLLVRANVALEAGKEKLAQDVQLVLGGSSAITAFNLSRLKTKVSFAGVIGADTFGQFVEARLTAAGVDLSSLRRSDREKTGITVWFDQSGKRAGITLPGTIPLLRASDIRPDHLKSARHLHVGHYFLLEKLHAQAPALFARAKRLGLSTSLDSNYDPAERWDSRIMETLQYVDIFFPNESEAMAISGETTPQRAAEKLGKVSGTVVIKMGARGVLVLHEGKSFRVPAVKTKVVDTTGAGDSFNAGFLSRFLRGASVRESAAAGVAAAARCVSKVGGTAAFELKK